MLKNKKIIAGIILANLIISHSALGNLEAFNESEIFPFSQKRTIDYSEDFYEVTNEGIYNENGEIIEISNENETKKIAETLPSNKDIENDDDWKNYQKSILSNWGDKKLFTGNRLKSIKENLNDEKIRFIELQKEIDKIEKEFSPLKEKIDDLKSHIKVLNEEINLSKEKIKNVELQIIEKQLELKDSMWKLKEKEIKLKHQKEAVLSYINLIYEEEERFLDYYENGSSTLKLLLSENSISENLMGNEYAQVIESSGRKVFYELYEQKNKLKEEKEDLEKSKNELLNLKEKLNNEKAGLEERRIGKKELLEKTLGEEEKYQKLLDESIQQQLNSAIAIQNMKENVGFIEEKLNLLDDSIEEIGTKKEVESNEKIDELNHKVEEAFSSLPKYDRVPSHQPFIWPVPPVKITAEFHDPHYPKKWGLHNAVDLRAPQSTEIIAPANGYVFQTKDNGLGYSYIILAHKNNLVTVYGHVSKILVKAGAVVKQGQVIGLSGGAIGTKGAGLQTTGPHLHFEVWKNGKAVDPLNYLPIDQLPINEIPKRFLNDTSH